MKERTFILSWNNGETKIVKGMGRSALEALMNALAAAGIEGLPDRWKEQTVAA